MKMVEEYRHLSYLKRSSTKKWRNFFLQNQKKKRMQKYCRKNRKKQKRRKWWTCCCLRAWDLRNYFLTNNICFFEEKKNFHTELDTCYKLTTKLCYNDHSYNRFKAITKVLFFGRKCSLYNNFALSEITLRSFIQVQSNLCTTTTLGTQK